MEASELSGYAVMEWRSFPQKALSPDQHDFYTSIAVQPEYYHEWAGGKQSFTFVPFARLDQHDKERTHFDIRELTYLKAGEGHEWRIGIRKLFWGVTESQHLVDIINQTDLAENLDGEDKLGQPMVNLALIQTWGTLDLFLLPGFRDRTFPGIEGRLRTPLVVDTNQAIFESHHGRGHIDFAARWSRAIGDWDIGLSHFYGTSREPRLVFGIEDSGRPVLIPYYDVIHQTGLDVQATKGQWLWKLEAISRSGQGPHFWALTGGFEYTFSTILESPMDLGIIGEYLYDDRGSKATNPFQSDFMIGLRLTLNDVQNTEALLGLIVDRHTQARFFNFEASRRLGNQWKLNLEARGFRGIPEPDLFFGLRKDDYIQLELARYF
ncbi:MAG: hypothetical protein L0Y56_13500 [Nitrospira sp.]|nr:hypothetical protein [Nitrospira sp.]